MKKGFKTLTVLSLFGLGLGGLVGCGGSSTPDKTISISLDGTAIENGGSTHVDEGATFTLTATVNGGDTTDTVTWGTDAPTAFEFSATSGNEVSVKANTPTTAGWTIYAELESDSSVRSTVKVFVDEATKTYSLTLDTSEAKTTYLEGESFTADGLIVNVTEYLNGVAGDSYEIGSDEYTLSLAEGTVLTEVGTQTVTVTPNDTSIAAQTYEIVVNTNPAYSFFEAMNKIPTEGYVEYVTDNGGTLYPYVVTTSDWSVDFSFQRIYHKTSSQIDRYSFDIDDEGYPLVTYTGFAYTNKEPETDFKTVIDRTTVNGVSLLDWDSSYEDGVTVSDGSLVLSDEAQVFFNNVYNQGTYEQTSSGSVEFVPYDVTITPVQLDDSYTVYMVLFSYDGQNVSGNIIGLNDSISLSQVQIFEDVIDEKDPSNYSDESADYYETDVEYVLKDLAGADYFSYYSNYFYDTMVLTPDFIEADLDQEVAGMLGIPYAAVGYYNLKDDSTLESTTGETTQFNAGVVPYEIGSDGGLALGDSDGTTSFDEVKKSASWGGIDGVTTEDAYKYWQLDTIYESAFTAGSQTYSGVVYKYSIYDNSADIFEILSSLEFGVGSFTFTDPDTKESASYYELVYGDAKLYGITLSLSLVEMNGSYAIGPTDFMVMGELEDGSVGALDIFSMINSTYFTNVSPEDITTGTFGSQLGDLFTPVASDVTGPEA